MEKGAVWIWAFNKETGRQIKKILDDANFINPTRFLDSDSDFRQCLRAAATPPLLGLVDLSLPDGKAWDIMAEARALTGDQIAFIVLIESGAESILDRAYDAGAKSYLTKPFAFPQFLERARLLKMHLSLTRPAQM